MDKRLMIKQRLGGIPATDKHARFEVFTSGEPGWYVLRRCRHLALVGPSSFRCEGKTSSPGGRSY